LSLSVEPVEVSLTADAFLPLVTALWYDGEGQYVAVCAFINITAAVTIIFIRLLSAHAELQDKQYRQRHNKGHNDSTNKYV
jgi:hypothetical protein